MFTLFITFDGTAPIKIKESTDKKIVYDLMHYYARQYPKCIFFEVCVNGYIVGCKEGELATN